MSEQILLQILEELQELKSEQRELSSNQEKLSSNQIDLISGQKELNQIVIGIRSNQETTNAKLEALTMDVRRLEDLVSVN